MKKSERIDIRVPIPLLKEIEQYQKRENISTRTGALLNLARIGLKQKKDGVEA
ncbi:hypothetical protein [Paenibacillus sp. RUD330]|uniref:hypothetical protein n=1 Tax=Paenibacillus sp. RUD330 TaxID=2023772 RepID=UPI0012FE2A6D|nr:hypothetical protein [Paenibacillus sp. RUD330]QID16081.1 hypothetical protein CIC07_25485 [Paenibacillus sp. RUD330]